MQKISKNSVHLKLHRPVKLLLVWLTLTSVLLCVLAVICVGPALFQEGNPLPIIAAALNLEFSKEHIVVIRGDDRMLLLKPDVSPYPLTLLLQKRGWKFNTQEGSIITYNKEKKDLVVRCRMWTKKYQVCELDQYP